MFQSGAEFYRLGRSFDEAEAATVREALVGGGWREWAPARRPDDVRLYWNFRIGRDLGVEVDRYRTGSLSYFAVRGHRWSNSSGRRVLPLLKATKLYFSVKDRAFVVKLPADRSSGSALSIFEQAAEAVIWPILREAGVEPGEATAEKI